MKKKQNNKRETKQWKGKKTIKKETINEKKKHKRETKQ